LSFWLVRRPSVTLFPYTTLFRSRSAPSSFPLRVLSFVRGSLAAPPKGDLLLPDDEISVIDDLGGDIDAVFHLEVEEVGLSVFAFVEGGFLAGAALDVGKRLVVVDHRHTKRL